MQCVDFWTKQGVRAAAYMLEDDKRYHLVRALSQIARRPELNDPEWVRANAEATRGLFKANEQEVLRIGRDMYDAPDEIISLDHVLGWMKKVTASGVKILVVDPITNVDTGKEPWNTEKQFLAKAKTILRRTYSTLVLVTHPKSNIPENQIPRLDQMASSLAYPRFSQSCFWLRFNKPEKRRKVRTLMGTTEEQVDRMMYIRKARNSSGANRGRSRARAMLSGVVRSNAKERV